MSAATSNHRDHRTRREYNSRMTIDERLEALNHRVELLADMHKDNEKHMRRLENQTRRLGKYIRSVAQLVLDHEARLRSLEDDDEDDDKDEEIN